MNLNVFAEEYNFLREPLRPLSTIKSNMFKRNWTKEIESFTWSKGLQVPGASGAARLYRGGQGGVDGPAGLHVSFLVPCGGDFEHRDGRTLLQHPLGRQHLGIALLAHTYTLLQGAEKAHKYDHAFSFLSKLVTQFSPEAKTFLHSQF